MTAPQTTDPSVCGKCGWPLASCDCCGMCGEAECDCATQLSGDTSEIIIADDDGDEL
jgi:hypothetical protein